MSAGFDALVTAVRAHLDACGDSPRHTRVEGLMGAPTDQCEPECVACSVVRLTDVLEHVTGEPPTELPLLASHVEVCYDLTPGELDGLLCGECPDSGPILPPTMLVTSRSAPDRDLHWTAVCGPDCGDESLRHPLRQRRDGRHPDMAITLRAPAAWGATGQVAS